MKKWMLIAVLALVALPPSLAQTATPATPAPATPKQNTRDKLVQGLIRIGEQSIVLENDAAADAYLTKDYILHSPLGETDAASLKKYWAAERAAFTDFKIKRDFMIVEGNFVSTQTTFTGVFSREFTQSPVGTLPPTGKPFTQKLMNIFRFTDDGRLAEEWVQYDTRDYLRQLGAQGR